MALKGLARHLENDAIGVLRRGDFPSRLFHPGRRKLLDKLHAAGIAFKDLHTEETSLEDIFVDLVRRDT